MPALAVVGAGPGLGMAVARTFGRRGFAVALISRSSDRLAPRVAELAALDVEAAGFAADVADRAGLTRALDQAADRFGGIDVLEYSPYPGVTPSDPVRMSVDEVRPEVENLLYGAVTATHAVLPAMLDRGRGTLLYTVGAGAIDPWPMLAPVNAAQAALRNWVHNLGAVVGGRGVYAATVAIGSFIGTAPPRPGMGFLPPDEIAATYWDLHEQRDRREAVLAAGST